MDTTFAYSALTWLFICFALGCAVITFTTLAFDAFARLRRKRNRANHGAQPQ
jgi:hypothetical protein